METIILIAVLLLLAEVTYLLTTEQKKAKQKSRRLTLIDTSVLIDGRIVAIAQSGFMSDTLIIPRSVVGELQLLADNADGDKRAKARHGLDVVTELQALDTVEVEILQDSTEAREGVDNRLLQLAKKHDAALCTIDYNLNKVAQVEGIRVLNVNELARTLRMSYLPGEKLMLALTTKGNDATQAVGHLDDGTMVVVEQAKSKIGSVVEVEVIRSLQTAAGKMMFARLIGREQLSTSDAPFERTATKKSTGQVKGRRKSPSLQRASQAATKKEDESPRIRRAKVRSSKDNESRLIALVNDQERAR